MGNKFNVFIYLFYFKFNIDNQLIFLFLFFINLTVKFLQLLNVAVDLRIYILNFVFKSRYLFGILLVILTRFLISSSKQYTHFRLLLSTFHNTFAFHFSRECKASFTQAFNYYNFQD